MLQDDIRETEKLGMAYYLTDHDLSIVNHFAGDHHQPPQAPEWGSTKNPSVYGKPYDGPREGIQRADLRIDGLYVQWDVAHSEARPISYVLYAKQGTPFDQTQSPEEQAKPIQLMKGMPTNYAGGGDRSNRFPYESKVEGLEPGKTYYLMIRARNAVGQFEGNWKSIFVTMPK